MAEPTRKLAAIVFTDIAGYTALSAHDEEKALRLNRSDPRIRAQFKTITRLLLEKMAAS